MTPADPLPLALAQPVFAVDDARRLGIPYARLRRSDLLSSGRGLRQIRGVELTLLDRAGPLSLLTPGTAVSHCTAARLWGIPLPYDREEAEEIHLIRPRGAGQPRRPGIVGHNGPLLPGDVVEFRDIRLTSPARTWADLARNLSLPALVAAGDSLLRRTDAPGRGGDLLIPDPLSSMAAMTATVGRRARAPGIVRARRALPLLRSGADSAPESKLRLLIVFAGLPEPTVNEWILDANGRRVSRPDLQYLSQRVALEYDGDHHRLSTQQWNRDIDRDDRLRAMGWTVLRFTREHLKDYAVARTVAKIRGALEASAQSVQQK